MTDDTQAPAQPDPAAPQRRSPVLVIGLGNPILGDDRVGWLVAEQVARRLPNGAAEVDCLALGGLSLMERMIGYERVVLIDAVTTGRHAPGHVRSFPLEALDDAWAGHSGSAHDVTLKTALEIGRAMGARLPDSIQVVAIETSAAFDFSEALSPGVAAAVPQAVAMVLGTLADSLQAHGNGHCLPGSRG